MDTEATCTIRQRVLAVLRGEKPDRIPFIDRMDFWQRGLAAQGRLPERFHSKDLTEIHREIGFGQEEWLSPCAHKLRKLELVVRFEGQVILREYEPEVSFFPDLWGLVPADRPGETVTELITPRGRLSYTHRLLPESILGGTTRPQMKTHPVRSEDDFRVYQYIIEQAEFAARFEDFYRREREIGENGYLVPLLNRVPFQSLLIDAFGEVPFFYALHDSTAQVERLLSALDALITDTLEQLAGLEEPYIEFCDNLDGFMTNPRLFARYVQPTYQKYAAILHAQGKVLGSHTDGDLEALVRPLADSGLDVCESFTPAPITGCTFEDAWAAWEHGPLIWGGIPSYYLQPEVPFETLEERVEELLALVGRRPIILGIGDAVMSDNDVERVEWIARRVERKL